MNNEEKKFELKLNKLAFDIKSKNLKLPVIFFLEDFRQMDSDEQFYELNAKLNTSNSIPFTMEELKQIHVDVKSRLEELVELEKKEQETIIDPIFSAKIDVILSYNEKLRLTVNEKDASQSNEREFYILLSLIGVGLTEEEIGNAMRKFGMNIWANMKEEFKVEKLKSARELIAKKSIDNLKLYFDIEMKAVKTYPNKRNSIVSFLIQDKTVEMDAIAILNPQAFRAMYFSEMNYLLPPIKPIVWNGLMNYWTKKVGTVIRDSQVDDATQFVEMIVDEINTFILVSDREECIQYGRVFFDGEPMIEVPTYSIQKIIEKNRLRVTLTQASSWLDGFLVRGTKRVRIGKQLYRFWCFKKEKFDFDYENPMKKEE